MRRGAFLAGLALVPAAPYVARAQEEYDPAVSSATQGLRVLLGTGQATSAAGGGFVFNGRPYRGTFAYAPDGSVVSTVSIEEYLYSVVPREMSPSWPAAALQAQAICARTYVLQRSNPRRAYDVVPSELDQVYGGMASESPAGRAAVDATAGQVLRYGGGFAQILYSSCCGGHTEASSEAWGGPPFAYLAGEVCTHCTASPNYRWTRELDRQAVVNAFAAELAPLGALTQLRLGAVDASGRARTFELQTGRGSTFVKGATFRTRVGSRNLPSLLISKIDAAAEAPERISIEGGGMGHGVGLCQWGARGMSLDGTSFSDILAFYFPGTTIGHD